MEHVNAWKAAVTAVLGAITALCGWMGWLVSGNNSIKENSEKGDKTWNC